MKTKTIAGISAAVALTLNAALPVAAQESPEMWYEQGQAAVQEYLDARLNKRKAKNVILFVGDGMGITTVTAGRIFDGQLKGMKGEENYLSFEQFPYMGLAKTYNTNQQTPDSAGTMTAMMSGVKTKAGVIGVNQYALRKDCASSIGNETRTFLEEAEMVGMSTGIISTARITHATPAATYSHVPERGWEDDHDLTEEAVANGCKDIASQLIDFPYGNGIDVAMGGGRRSFIPRDMADPEDEGRTGERDDGRDLTEEWTKSRWKDRAKYVWNKEQFDAVDPKNTKRLLGLFNRSHMEYEADRADDTGGEPSLAEMTDKAIDILDNDRDGFFLMVESGRIDHGHHAGNAFRALEDTRAFADAVRTAYENTDPRETLIIVTADHGHVFTIAGYPTRGNPILGKVVGNDSSGLPNTEPTLAKDGLPYTTVAYANGRGFADLEVGGDTHYGVDIATGRHDLSGVDTEGQGFHQEALVPMSSETHSAEDVAVYASGPWGFLFQRTQEQNYLYHVMRHAAKIDQKRDRHPRRY